MFSIKKGMPTLKLITERLLEPLRINRSAADKKMGNHVNIVPSRLGKHAHVVFLAWIKRLIGDRRHIDNEDQAIIAINNLFTARSRKGKVYTRTFPAFLLQEGSEGRRVIDALESVLLETFHGQIFCSECKGIRLGKKWETAKINGTPLPFYNGMLSNKLTYCIRTEFLEESANPARLGFVKGGPQPLWDMENSQIDPEKLQDLTYPFIAQLFKRLISKYREALIEDSEGELDLVDLEEGAKELACSMYSDAFGYNDDCVVKHTAESNIAPIVLTALFETYVEYFGCPIGSEHAEFVRNQKREVRKDLKENHPEEYKSMQEK
jgi:hypothetical protein